MWKIISWFSQKNKIAQMLSCLISHFIKNLAQNKILYIRNLNVLGAYLYAKNSEIKLYAIQNAIVAIPKPNIGIFICII